MAIDPGPCRWRLPDAAAAQPGQEVLATGGDLAVEPVDEPRSWFSVLAVDSGSGPPPAVHRPAASLFNLLPVDDAVLAGPVDEPHDPAVR